MSRGAKDKKKSKKSKHYRSHHRDQSQSSFYQEQSISIDYSSSSFVGGSDDSILSEIEMNEPITSPNESTNSLVYGNITSPSISSGKFKLTQNKVLYTLYLLLAGLVLFQLSIIDFVRSTGIQNPNPILQKNSSDRNITNTSESDPSMELVAFHDTRITGKELIDPSMSHASKNAIQNSSRQTITIFSQVQVSISTNVRTFFRSISSFFQRIIRFFSPALESTPDTSTSTSNNSHSHSHPASQSSTSVIPVNLTWAGKPITDKEIEAVEKIRDLIDQNRHKFQSKWSQSIHFIEILRFLRAKHHHLNHAYQALLHHDQFRRSEYGPESSFVWTGFEKDSPLFMEGFWMGYNKEGCPTLVLRTQLHDGYYYNDDPKIYTAFMVRLLEEGRKRYQIGIDHQICVLMDRAGTVWKNGKRKVDKLDMAVIPGLIQLFRHLYSVLTENYPDVLHSCRIAPASKFFSMCYKITSRVMASQYREKFQMIESTELSQKLHTWIDRKYLPNHLGGIVNGSEQIYSSVAHIEFDPYKSSFPITSKRRKKQVEEDYQLYYKGGRQWVDEHATTH